MTTYEALMERVILANVLRAKDLIVVGTPRAAAASYAYLIRVSGVLTRAEPEKPKLVQISL